jgi:fibronectin type 3 domain-containing protein
VVESGLAEEVEVDYRDRFAPPVPKGLLALAEEGRVRLVWEVSPAPDVAGYRVFRRGPDTQEFRPVTEELLTATELVDRDLAPGATYSYRVTAVDRLGNESEPSPAAMATAR